MLGVALWVQRLHMAELTPTPFEISRYDNRECIRIRKYITGTQFDLEGAGVETGRTPKETLSQQLSALDHFATPAVIR